MTSSHCHNFRKPRFHPVLALVLIFVICGLIAITLHEPQPRTHDEFSYAVLANAVADGHLARLTPVLPEFFETFHVLVRPVYASKYFPAQGIFLGIGERATGHPAVGAWLSSAMAAAAVVWMLQACIDPSWSLLGGLLMALQYGIFSYWSQSYWGGMVAALGGSLFFGATRRLWDRFSVANACWMSLGLVILATSRPSEGLVAVSPLGIFFLYRLCRNRRWSESGFWTKLVLPCSIVVGLGATAMGTYNRAITGSAFTTPYSLHEKQYQESPPYVFMSMRSPIEYSSPVLAYYYHVQENRLWALQRNPAAWIGTVGRKLGTWWAFYCGAWLSIPLVLPGVLNKKTRYWQIAVFLLLLYLALTTLPHETGPRMMLDLVAVAQLALLWVTFDGFWSHIAIATGCLVMFLTLFSKWDFPHYFAPAACLVLYLQVQGLKYIWNWKPHSEPQLQNLSRTERRRLARENKSRAVSTSNLRWIVYALPVLCFLSLTLRVAGRRLGWNDDPHGPDRQALLMNDWSLKRSELEKWMEHQPTPQLVFVRYSQHHNVNFEWVYNHANIMHSHVIWARDLGVEHNRELLKLLPDRTVWLLEADAADPQLVSYSTVDSQWPGPVPGSALPEYAATEHEDLNW